MADMQQKAVPLPTATVDEESVTVQSEDFHGKKWVIVAVWITAFLVVQALLFVSLDMILLRGRAPNYRLQSVSVENLRVSNGTATPSFNIQLNAQVTLRNRNFGSCKFHDGYLTFSYRDKPVGEAVITESGVKARSTKTMGIVLNVTCKATSRNSYLGKDIASGLVRMTTYSNLRGQVRFLKVYPKDKSAKMNCDLTINLVKKIVQDLRCD